MKIKWLANRQRDIDLLWLMALAVILTLLTACESATLPSPTTSATNTARPATATPEPTPAPRRQLTICGTEPETVSPFTPSQAGDNVLALFYEPPVERVGYQWQARLVERIPSIAAGDVITQDVWVQQGERYVDPSGAVKTHDEPQALQLAQMVVSYTLKTDLRWSDGEALTADDVVLGYHLAQSQEARGKWRTLVERTARFRALDQKRLVWEGLPGYLTTDYPGFLFPPQPTHRWQGQRLTQILEDRTPPGTGAFEIVAWEGAREVRLRRNPHYTGDTPQFETIVYRFPQQAPSTWDSLLSSGQCDIVLPDPSTETDWRQWSALQALGKVTLWANAAPTVLRLDLNVAPIEQESDPLTDQQVRRAIGLCINREGLSNALPSEAFLPATTFIPPGHPMWQPDSTRRNTYDPELGQALLEKAGWRDENDDGLREAYEIEGITDGTPLSLTLHLAPQYFVSAAYIAADLERCGIAITPMPTEAQILYAADSTSPLFGRTFQLALFGWQVTLPQVCGSWLSARIPNAENRWNGENFSGYALEGYDAACLRSLTAIEATTQEAALREAQGHLAEDQPSLFLTWRPHWCVSRPEIQGLQPDASSTGMLWNIEAVHIKD